MLGVNSLRYFLNKRPAQAVADDLADQLRAHQAKWGRQKILLVGYSFGATPYRASCRSFRPTCGARSRAWC